MAVGSGAVGVVSGVLRQAGVLSDRVSLRRSLFALGARCMHS